MSSVKLIADSWTSVIEMKSHMELKKIALCGLKEVELVFLSDGTAKASIKAHVAL